MFFADLCLSKISIFRRVSFDARAHVDMANCHAKKIRCVERETCWTVRRPALISVENVGWKVSSGSEVMKNDDDDSVESLLIPLVDSTVCDVSSKFFGFLSTFIYLFRSSFFFRFCNISTFKCNNSFFFFATTCIFTNVFEWHYI